MRRRRRRRRRRYGSEIPTPFSSGATARARRTLGKGAGDDGEVTAVPYSWYSPSPLLGSGLNGNQLNTGASEVIRCITDKDDNGGSDREEEVGQEVGSVNRKSSAANGC